MHNGLKVSGESWEWQDDAPIGRGLDHGGCWAVRGAASPVGGIVPPPFCGAGVPWYLLAVRTPLAIWGTSGHARVVADIVRCGELFEIVGFLDDLNPDRHGQEFCYARVLGGRSELPRLLAAGVRHLILAFGDNAARYRLGAEMKKAGFSLGTAIHPRSIVAADARIGQGTVIAAGAVVNPHVTIGENVIVNTGATVDHDGVLGDAVHISPGAHLAGGVRVGCETWIGMGSLILEGRDVGARTIIGAGSVVTRAIGDDVVAFGVPARVVRSRKVERT